MVLFWSAGASIAIAILAALGDRRRVRRTDPDAVGWWDWRTLQMAALLAAAILVALGAHAT